MPTVVCEVRLPNVELTTSAPHILAPVLIQQFPNLTSNELQKYIFSQMALH